MTGESAPAPAPVAPPAWAGGALGPAVPLERAPRAHRETTAAAGSAASGTLASPGEEAPSRAAGWVAALRDYRRADLLGTVTEYLRHRGRWEEASRALGVHRNSVRHRIGVASALLAADLDDPDVAAELWLALRRDEAPTSTPSDGR